MKQLLLGKEGRPVLETYTDGPVQEGYVRVECDFGAPKHEQNGMVLEMILLQKNIMMRKHIFSGNGKKSW